MQICKNAKISALIIFLMFSLLLPAGKILAADPAVTEPTKGCQIKPGEECPKDTDGDGFDDIIIKNITAAGGAPKLITRSLKIKSTGGSQFIESPGIANYIASIYKYAVGLITILTTIMIIISGVMWITSAGNPEKINKAKQMIARSLTGLIIALGSYTLLFTINPDLVEFRALQVMRIDKGTIEIPEDYSMPEEEGGVPSELESTLVPLKDITGITIKPGKDGRATLATAANLGLAMEQFKKYNSGGAIINYAIRTPAQQYGILSRNCGCPVVETLLQTLKKAGKTKVLGNEWPTYCPTVGTPTCPAGYKTLTLEITDGDYTKPPTFKAQLISHFSGNALDISASKTGSNQPCGGEISDENEKLSAGVANAGKATGKDVCIPKEQQKLIRAMLDNNFCVGLGGSRLREPWHFELTGVGKNSSFCAKDLNDANLKKLYYVQNPEKN